MTAVEAGATVYSEAESATEAVGALEAPLVELLLPDAEVTAFAESPEPESPELPQPVSSAAIVKMARNRPNPASSASNFIRSRLRFGWIPSALRRSNEMSNSGMTVTRRPVRSMRCRQPRCLTDHSTLRPEALRPRLAAGLPFTLRCYLNLVFF
jgi:hypothetical protein